MAQIIPSITSLPVDSSAAPSVEDIQDRLPSICVDYLSHDWSEEDVWASWRNMTRHKHEIANGVRLENASWRTWQKQRNKLKTISPETLNWLKDSDVTWLYGPLHTAQVEPVRPLKISSTVERFGIDGPVNGPAKKPILKHRTLSEMLTIPMPASPILESYSAGDSDVEELEDHRPGLIQTKSDTNILRSRNTMTNRRKSPSRAPISGKATPLDGTLSPALPSPEDSLQTGGSTKRHISFNTFVEQVMAIDDPSDLATIDSDEDEMLEMRSSSSRSSRPSLPRSISTGSTGSEHLTIAKIAPTMLKTQAFSNSDQLPLMIYQPTAEYLSPVINKFGGSPSPRGGWAEEEDEAGNYDYFGGPNLQDPQPNPSTSPYRVQSVPVHQGQSYRAPTVNQPPSQPKWRQGPAQSPASTSVHPSQSSPSAAIPSSIDSSTSSSSASLSHQSASPQSQPAPARSILKVRAPGPTPPEPTSPTHSYFNYTPSAATGIGGMRGQYIDPVIQGQASTGTAAVGSPLISPASEERGRRTSRERGTGTSAFDRSSSRGTTGSSTSTSGSTSISPGASRSPVGLPRKVQPTIQQQQQTQRQDSATHVENIDESQGMDIDADERDYSPPDGERGSTPTPHSSPQISLRPLIDTSPASLPHHTTHPSSIHTSTSTSTSASTLSSDPSMTSPLPWADPQRTISPPLPQLGASGSGSGLPTSSSSTSLNSMSRSAGSSGGGAGGGGGRATIAQVSTQAKPMIQNNKPSDRQGGEVGDKGEAVRQVQKVTLDSESHASTTRAGGWGLGLGGHYRSPSGSSNSGAGVMGRLQPQGSGQRRVVSSGGPGIGAGGVGVEGGEGENESIMGRAANIANTAKDLLGALWYGANPTSTQGGVGSDGSQTQALGQGQGQGQGVKPTRHKRGASMG